MTITFKPKLNTPCILTTWGRTGAGYGHKRDEHGKFVLAHRVAYCEAHGLTLADIEGVVIRHRCDNPPCINPEHLEPGTQKDNMHDKVLRGRNRSAYGETNGKTRLTAEQVRTIRQRRAEGHRLKVLAAEYGVTTATISRISTGKRWNNSRYQGGPIMTSTQLIA